MSEQSLCTAGELRQRVAVGTLMLSGATVAFISIYLVALLDFSSREWSHFGLLVVGLFPVLFALVLMTNARLEAPIIKALRAEEQGGATREELVGAYAALSRLPLVQSIAGLVWWCLGGGLVAIGMKLGYPALAPFSVTILCLAAASGGFIASVFHYFINKAICKEPLEELGFRLEDEALRRRNATRLTLRLKLMVSVTGVSVVIVVFAMLLATVHSGAPVERNATRVQTAFLDAELRAMGPGSARSSVVSARRTIAERARDLKIADDVVLIDLESGAVLGKDRANLSPMEMAAITTVARGESTAIDSSHAFIWERVPDTQLVMVVVSEWSTLRGDWAELGVVFGGLLAMAALLSFMLAAYLSREVSARSLELEEAALRVAAGDLRVTVRMEAEDEIGDLARSFAGMATALRTAVSGVVGAADHVERAAEGIAGIATVVSRGAEEQNQGVRHAVTTMERINAQVGGVAAAAGELNGLVEESSSSILEMGAAGDELNDTAGVLSSRVEEVSSSIEQMVRSVKEVGSHTGSLSEAANETSSSMEEMASAMRAVDTTAQEAAGLSSRAVDAAEGGRTTVQQTIVGMESIRAATETAEKVITGLVGRTAEIGSILDVIDDVADETGLLALNAAIIAAQAGEHGRAFSVVADEIKELADRVLSSTKEIGDVIRAVQTESRNAVGAIADGSRSVAAGVELSQQAGTALEAITSVSQENGQRIHEILRSVQEQSRAAGHVVEMMERVNDGAEAIHRATDEQDRGNEVVYRSTVAMREVATQVRNTTEEQSRGGARIRTSIEGVRDAAESIDAALQQQTAACQEVVGFLERVSDGSTANHDSSQRLSEATSALLEQAEMLREGVRHFIIQN